jgi:hypothetical protein
MSESGLGPSAASVTSAGSGQLSPAAWKRLSVARTVDAATPIRRAISRVGTPPTNFNRRTSRTQHRGRDHLGMVGGITSESASPYAAARGRSRGLGR